MSKVFTILSLLAFDRAKYMGNVQQVLGLIYIQTNVVSAADAPFPPSRSFAHVKEAQMDMLHGAHGLEHAMIV